MFWLKHGGEAFLDKRPDEEGLCIINFYLANSIIMRVLLLDDDSKELLDPKFVELNLFGAGDVVVSEELEVEAVKVVSIGQDRQLFLSLHCLLSI